VIVVELNCGRTLRARVWIVVLHMRQAIVAHASPHL
jgi:hypothetical protein